MVDQYIFSGSLPENASTYVTRKADDELYEALLQGKFCYVLNSRQSGKSSLRVRTMSRLGEAGIECASIDLSSINIQTATQENWYADLIVKLIDNFVLDVDFKGLWEQNQLNSPLLRFSSFLSKILLTEVPENLVIFIDEIDSVLSLNFPTDDFFAFIRSCYNQRVDNPKYNRLTFCLLGVASPSSLIQDKNRTPFNIGKAISLKGFQLHEVEPLEKGLRGKFSNSQAIMQQILQSTGGQPFLTQKLCQFMVEESEQENPRSVEQVVRSRIIENWESQDEPEHLRTIQARILRDEQRAGYLLELYQQVRLSEKEVELIADDTLEQSELQLSGLVFRQQGSLKIYNQIYREIFDSNWIDRQLKNLRPYSENFRFWVASGGADDSRLLRGKALKEALEWVKDKNLSYQDRQFLAASREKGIQEEIATKEQEAALEREKKDREALETRNKVLSEANKKAQKRINIGTFSLISTLLITTILVFVAGKEVLKAGNARQEAKEALQAQIKAEETAKEVEKIAQSKVKAAKDSAKKATQTVEEASRQVASAQGELKKAQKEVQSAINNKNDAQEKVKQASNEVASAQGELKKAQKEAQSAINNKNDAQEKVKQASNEVASAQGELKKAQKEAQSAINNKNDAQEKVKQVSNEVVLANKKVAQANEKLNSVKMQSEQATQEINNLLELAKLGKDLHAKNKVKEAEEAWKQTALSLTIRDNTLRQAMLLSNMSKVYQQLGNLTDANKAVSESLKILEAKVDKTLEAEVYRGNFADRLVILAQAFYTKGRQLTVQGDIQEALSAHTEAFNILQSLYSDLTSISPATKVSFGEITERVYREFVGSLVQSTETDDNQPILKKALDINKYLKIAELNNFLGEEYFNNKYLEGKSDQIEEAESTAAVIYPFILPDKLQVIVKIPKQPLQIYSTKISQTEVEKLLVELRRNLVDPTATKIVQTQSQEVYSWLLKPIESQLQKSGVDTLVFVLDGPLRNFPMAALYDGKQYLVEKYAITLNLGLQLQHPQPLVKQKFKVLFAGLTEPPPGFPQFAPLLAIQSEVNSLSKAGFTTTKLLNKQFTSKALEKEVNKGRFNVVHLATHCQFSSRADQTFFLAADGPIYVKQLNSLLGNPDQNRSKAVELLVLSGCQTVVGDNRAALGLAGTAILAGARNTLAPLWQIDDESTAMFLSAFYRELKSGKITKAEAVHRAQLQLLKHPNYKALSFWAAYVLYEN